MILVIVLPWLIILLLGYFFYCILKAGPDFIDRDSDDDFL